MEYQDFSMANDENKCICGQAAAVICNTTRFTTCINEDGAVAIFLSYLPDESDMEKKDHIMLILQDMGAVRAMINTFQLAEKHFETGLDIDDLLDNQGKDGFSLLEIGNK